MTNQTPIEEATGYLEARQILHGILRQQDPGVIDTIYGKPLTARTVQCLLEQIKLDAERITKACAAGPTAWWFDTGEFDYDPPKLHATEQLARDAAVEHWRHFNYPRDVEFGWLQEPDDDPDHPDPNRGHELLAAGQKTGHFVRPIAVQGAPIQASPDAKLGAFDLSALLEPTPSAPDPHRVTVRTVRVLGPNREDDWADDTTYDIEHTPQCDALPYMQNCWLDQQQNDVGTDDWPTETGVYIATGEAVKYFNGEVTEYDFHIEFEPEEEGPCACSGQVSACPDGCTCGCHDSGGFVR